jgi:manganese transport protein
MAESPRRATPGTQPTRPRLNPRLNPLPEDVLPGEARVNEAAYASLEGRNHGLRKLWPFLGPAFIASVAYVDPGNFATNIAAGAKYGYLLLWVVVAANLMAMLVQALSAKLGIATGLNLPEVCRQHFPRSLVYLLWLQAEVVAMATDLAEFVGAALGLHLLFGVALFPAGLLTAVAAFAILAMQARGFRPLEAVIAALVGVIVVAFAFEVVVSGPSLTGALQGAALPRLADRESVLLAAGILGATMMPHVIYLHSALTQRRVVGRSDAERRQIFRFELIDVIVALAIAGLINVSMLVMAAGAFHSRGLTNVSDLGVAYHELGLLLTGHANVIFGIALLASGLSSSSVGTLAGQVVMQGFINRRIPLTVRRLATMAPALLVLGIGLNASRALVLSQVVLSFGIPFALVPLVYFCRRQDVMGALVNRALTTLASLLVVLIVVSLNVFLLAQLFFS